MPQLDYQRIVKFGQKTTFVGLSYSLLNLIPQGPVHSGPESLMPGEGREAFALQCETSQVLNNNNWLFTVYKPG